jgi:hypothetical protein
VVESCLLVFFGVVAAVVWVAMLIIGGSWNQNDYFEGGSFPVPDAEAIVDPINSLRDKHFDMVFVCSTTHLLSHSGFCANNPVRCCVLHCMVVCSSVWDVCGGCTGVGGVWFGRLGGDVVVCVVSQGVEMFSVVSFPNTGPQTMYPDHCVLVCAGHRAGSCVNEKYRLLMVWLCWLVSGFGRSRVD